MSGLFSAENATVEVFAQFCRNSVPPILFPYVREIVHRSTMDAQYGTIKIGPINIQDLISRSVWESETEADSESTEGKG